MKQEKKKRIANKEIRDIRKNEILTAAKKAFVEKGFEACTMEDIIAKTSLSKGDFYYYYKNTVDILHDLMSEGIRYRFEKMKEFMETYSGALDRDAMVEMLVDKMLDSNELMSVYVVYLQAMKNNDELKKLFAVLANETFTSSPVSIFGIKIGDFECFTGEFFIHLMNSIILGSELLDARATFVKNRAFFVAMLKLYVRYYYETKGNTV